MSTTRAATAAAHPRTAAGRRPRPAVAPRAPRRVSGPAAGRRVAVPVPPGARRALAAAPATAVLRPPLGARVLGGVRSAPDNSILDGLLRSRSWIWVVAVLLGGIVFAQVSLLKLNAGISRAVESAATLQRQNAELAGDVARLSSGERITRAAARLGMVMPSASDVRFLTARPEFDAGRAVEVIRPPGVGAEPLQPAEGATPAATAGAGAAAAGAPAATAAPPAPAASVPAQAAPPVTGAPAAPAATAPAAPAAPHAHPPAAAAPAGGTGAAAAAPAAPPATATGATAGGTTAPAQP